MLCDAPPAREKNAEFLAVAEGFSGLGVRVPRVLGADLERGWLCLEDLGDQLLLPLLDDESADRWYAEAMAMLRALALAGPGSLDLPLYSRERLLEEVELFSRWFCDELLEMPLNGSARGLFDRLADTLCKRALAQPQVPVHRDFHARNLMVLADGSLAAIDFQDAVIGPLTYDLVSLLRDCYRRWPAERVRGWALAQHQALATVGMAVPDADAFLMDLDWMGLQRHIKVLGIFARLWLRDGKDGYLGDLPRVMAYVSEVLAGYPDVPALADFAHWFEREIRPRAEGQPWYWPA